MQYAGSWYDGEGYSGQQQQQYGPTPDAGIVPFAQPSSYDAPSIIQPSISQQQGHRPPRTQTIYTSGSRRRANSNSSKPIRSALQGPDRARTASVNRSVLRKRRQSGGAETRPRNSIARSTTNTSSRTDPDHVFMSVHPPNGLELSNIAYKATVKVLRENIFPMWPAGARQELYGHDWRVRFSGRPWDSKGHESALAQRMLCRVFWVLASQGYVYLTTINTGYAFRNPQLVFIRAPADSRTHFFAMSLNGSGNRITFVDPPAAVVNSLGLSLRAAFPHRIANDHESEGGIFTITLKSGINAMGPEKNLFMAHILKYINDLSFKLDASVPLARRGLFGMSGRKEIWVFKGSESWWPNRK